MKYSLRLVCTSLLASLTISFSYSQVGIEVGPGPAPARIKKPPVKKSSKNSCARLVGNEWVTMECPGNSDCGEKNPAKYPWVVIIYVKGRYDGINDFKTKEAAEKQMQWSEHFNNKRWPRFSNTEYNLYKYTGPFRKCETTINKLTDSRIIDMVRPYVEEWKNKLAQAYRTISQNRDYGTRSAFAEYMRGLRNAEKSVNNLENILNHFTSESLDYITENIGNLYEAGNQMTEAKKVNSSSLPYGPLPFKIPTFANEEVKKRKKGVYEFGDRYKLAPGSGFKLSSARVVNNSTILYFESNTGGRVNKGNENEFFIVDRDGFRYKLTAVNGVTTNRQHNVPIRFSCTFLGRLNNASGPFHLIEGKNAPQTPNEESTWWNIYNIRLE